MITLPAPPRRAHLRSFWFALCTMLGTSATVCMYILALPHPLAIPAVTVVCLVAVGLVMTEWIRPLYGAWNRGARLVARGARLLLMGICFFIVFAAVGLAGARFGRAVSMSPASSWVRRRTEDGEEDLSPFAAKSNGSMRMKWTKAYFHWARSTGNLWAVVLLPFLSLLSLLAEDEDDTLPAYVYTLF
jgi:hypothetical protein